MLVLSSTVEIEASSFGADFRFVHNPLAANPVPRGTLRFGVEYWVHDDQLIWKNWNEDTV